MFFADLVAGDLTEVRLATSDANAGLVGAIKRSYREPLGSFAAETSESTKSASDPFTDFYGLDC